MDSQVQEIKDKVSINDVVGQYVKLKKVGRNFSGLCPFHKERTPSFMVSPERGTYICFGCGEKGDIFSFVQRMEGVDFLRLSNSWPSALGSNYKNNLPKVLKIRRKMNELHDACEETAVFF